QVLPHPGLPAASDPPRGGGAHLPDGARPGGRAVEPDAVLGRHHRTQLADGPGMGQAGPDPMSLWQAGGGTILLLAGMNGIPKEFYEAAEIDGASGLQQFWTITFPQLTPVIFF